MKAIVVSEVRKIQAYPEKNDISLSSFEGSVSFPFKTEIRRALKTNRNDFAIVLEFE